MVNHLKIIAIPDAVSNHALAASCADIDKFEFCDYFGVKRRGPLVTLNPFVAKEKAEVKFHSPPLGAQTLPEFRKRSYLYIPTRHQ